MSSSGQGTRSIQPVPARLADYIITGFQYTSSQAGVKQWKMKARRAFFFNAERLVHALDIDADLYDSEGKITHVIGNEAFYDLNTRVLNTYGNVKTRMPDGFETFSEHLRFLPNDRVVRANDDVAVHGGGISEEGQKLEFESVGLIYTMATGEIILPKDAKVRVYEKNPKTPGAHTLVESDLARLQRTRNTADFSMSPERPLDERFVKIKEETMYTQSRMATLNYGQVPQKKNSAPAANAGSPGAKDSKDTDSKTGLNYMYAIGDVTVRELGRDKLRYATGGHATFDRIRNVVILTQFPQAYQDNDTITGDYIILHRDSDIVEVEKSNAFSEGQENQ